MTAARDRFIQQLEDAADRIADIPRHELAILLRRAAIRLRNVDGIVIEPEVDKALADIAAEIREPKPDLIRRVLREWLEQNAYLPVLPDLDEDSETDGVA